MILFRKLKQNRSWILVNIPGLTAAIACVLIITLYTRQQLSYDRFHSKADRIYRVTMNTNTGATSMHAARVYGHWPEELKKRYPVIEKKVRLIPLRRAVIKIGTDRFYSEKVFATDSTFFDLFDFKVITGNPQTAFTKPKQAWISRTLAEKYFGNRNAMGKTISVSGDKSGEMSDYTIEGILDDFPENTHFHADILTSATEFGDEPMWAFTYFLLTPDTDVSVLLTDIHKNWKRMFPETEDLPLIHLQKLTEIHLRSHLTREIEKNGDILSIYLLVSGALIVFIIAMVNFLNMNKVKFISQFRTYTIKRINGASRLRLCRESAAESLFISIPSLVFGILMTLKLQELLELNSNPVFLKSTLYIFAPILLFTIAGLTLIPLATAGGQPEFKRISTRRKIFTLPLIIQFSLAILTISGTLILNKQLHFLNDRHPASRNDDILVIPFNPQTVVLNYELLKTELLKHPEILQISSAMEEPGGDINDAFHFVMEGIQTSENQSINILTTDSGFFDFMNIKPLAGTIHLGYTPSLEWEKAAMELSMMEQNGIVNPDRMAELRKIVGDYREKYILNESALRLLAINDPEKAVGKRFRISFFMPYVFPEGEIAGVVPDFHYTNLHHKERPLVIAPRKTFSSNFLIRFDSLQKQKALSTLQTVWNKVNPDYPLNYQFIADSYKNAYKEEYSQTRVISLFALIAIILSSLGVFAVSSYSMQSRIKEIGIRKVNGAAIFQILLLLNRDLFKWILIALVISSPPAWYIMQQWLSNFAYQTAVPVWVFLVSGASALGIALLTISWKSWRAATSNPVDSLRYE